MKLVLNSRKGRTKGLCAFLAAVCLCLGICSVGCTKTLHYTIEAGRELPNPYKLIPADGAAYVAGFDENCIYRPGTYKIPMTDASGQKYQLKLTVRDRKAPVVTTRHVYYPRNVGVPKAEDFINTIVEADEYTAAFTCDLPDMTEIGDYDISFRVKDASGNRTRELHSVMTVIEDRESPVFAHVPELSAYVGEAIAYRKGLQVVDNCGGDIRIEVDASGVNPAVPGDYPVHFAACDLSGNTATAETVIHIYENQITEEQLLSRIGELAARLTEEGMSREQKLRAVYRYINEEKHIAYVSDSDKSDWIRAAYDSLFVTGTGDCFNYFAAAKAFCVYFGIEFLEIERTPGVAEGTHYWMLVNIGTKQEPRWYHYDCTRLRTSYTLSSCLLTDRQIRAYNRYRAGFYEYDASAYPKSAQEIITKTKELEKYY